MKSWTSLERRGRPLLRQQRPRRHRRHSASLRPWRALISGSSATDAAPGASSPTRPGAREAPLLRAAAALLWGRGRRTDEMHGFLLV